MRYAHKTLRKKWILSFYVGLVMGFLSIFITSGLSLAESITCGAEITTYTKLTSDLNCEGEGGRALTITAATLDLNGHRVIGSSSMTCIPVCVKHAEKQDKIRGNPIVCVF